MQATTMHTDKNSRSHALPSFANHSEQRFQHTNVLLDSAAPTRVKLSVQILLGGQSQTSRGGRGYQLGTTAVITSVSQEARIAGAQQIG
jgi:hypothetical protein